MRIGCYGSSLGEDDIVLSRNVSADRLDISRLSRLSSEPTPSAQRTSVTIQHASTVGASPMPVSEKRAAHKKGVKNGDKMYLLTCFRLAIALVQPERVLVGDYLMNDT